MISVDIHCESRYKVDRKRIKTTVESTLIERGVTGDVEVSIVICGERKMRELHRKYMDDGSEKGSDDELHDVLSFPLEGVEYPGDQVLRLGDMVICYPVAIKEAAIKNMLVDDEIDFLVQHSCIHLMGIHHD